MSILFFIAFFHSSVRVQVIVQILPRLRLDPIALAETDISPI